VPHTSTFGNYSLSVCPLPISQTKPIISLNSINRLFFVVDTQCVYCEVGIYIIYISVLQTGFHKGRQGFRETKMRNRGRMLMAALNFSVRTALRVATFDADHSVTDTRRQSVAASVQKLPRCAVRSVSTARHTQSMFLAIRSV
jgi:hypothetical protein